MRALELRIPPPLVAAVFMVCMWLLTLYPQPELMGRNLRIVLAVFVVIVGQGIAIAGMIAFRQARTTINPVRASDASSLVDGGIYRLTRNPMYLGWALTLLAWSLYLGNLLALAAVPIFAWYITRFQIKPEERVLTQLFGEQYVLYSSTVRRWI
jgi:protein-S-isoprenylcysteine O-methyltransferase Ste14